MESWDRTGFDCYYLTVVGSWPLRGFDHNSVKFRHFVKVELAKSNLSI